MIEFITLFLGGLLTGPRTVEFMVAESVATVEVRLDGELAGRLDTPPWSLELDFGQELSPHVIDAAALDVSGHEVGHVRQWINMSPKPAQTAVVIEGTEGGQGAVARVIWESLGESCEPLKAEAFFDGQELTVGDPRSIRLPNFDPDATHYLRIRLEFPELQYSEAEVVFGGIYGSEVDSGLTAIPVVLARGGHMSAASVADLFAVEGVPQRVHSVEKGLAEIVVVRDLAAIPHLEKLASRVSRLATDIVLRRDLRISFVSPCPDAFSRDEGRQIVFRRSKRHSSKDGTLLELLARTALVECALSEQQLAEAMAIAGLTANEDGLRRMVIVVLSGTPRDQSHLTPVQVRAYLRRLRVPLEIWSVGPLESWETCWGAATNVRNLRQLNRAYRLVEKRIDRQRIVWLEGLHLPQWLELRPDADDLFLAE